MAPTRSTKGGQPAQRLKIVVRRLPPDLPEAVFWRSVSPWVTRETGDAVQQGAAGAETVAWSEFKPGKVRKPSPRPGNSGKDKDSVPSRAYITFTTPDALVAFHRGYDGWSFRDKLGNVSQAVVEFAPYQRTPAAPPKTDPRQGTIDQDPDFLAFQTALTAPPVEEPPPEPVPETNPKLTPLLLHLRAQKAAEQAARKAAIAASKKGKQPAVVLKQEGAKAAAGGKKSGNGKGKNKEGKKERGKGTKSKEGSRSGTPTPAAAAAAGAGGGGAGTS
ncbi:SPOSA6832_01400, partial [Sporobolomyces salmonicolor]